MTPAGLILVSIASQVAVLHCAFQVIGCLSVLLLPVCVTLRNIYCFPALSCNLCSTLLRCLLEKQWNMSFYYLAALWVWNPQGRFFVPLLLAVIVFVDWTWGCAILTFLVFHCCGVSMSLRSLDQVLLQLQGWSSALAEMWPPTLFLQIHAWV